MDDLLLVIAHEIDDKHKSIHRDLIKETLLDKNNGLYTGGLEAELQTPEFENDEKFIIHFAGHEVHIHKNGTAMFSKTLNHNTESIKTLKKQKKIRFPYDDTYTHSRVKTGVIIGALHNAKNTCTYRSHFTAEVLDLLEEFNCIGYDPSILKKCIKKLSENDHMWKCLLEEVITKYNTRNKAHRTPDIKTLIRTTPLKFRHIETSDSETESETK